MIKASVLFFVFLASISFYSIALRRIFITKHYILPLIVLSFAVVFAIFRGIDSSNVRFKTGLKVFFMALIAGATAFFYFGHLSRLPKQVVLGINPPYAAESVFNRSKGILMTPGTEDSMSEAVLCVQKHLKQNETLYVGNISHEYMSMNNIIFYFISERECCTKYHELSPGVANTEEVQKEIANDIIKKNVPIIVLTKYKFTSDGREPYHLGSRYLDDFIRLHYVPEFSNKDFIILRRNKRPF